MPILHPRDRTYPRRIQIHEIAAGDVVRIAYKQVILPDKCRISVPMGIVAGQPGGQFRKRGRRYYVDIQAEVGGEPTLIPTDTICRVEMVAPGESSPATWPLDAISQDAAKCLAAMGFDLD